MKDILFRDLLESVQEGAGIMTEHDTQNAIIQLIKARGGLAIRINSGSIAKGARVIKGAAKGTSDIIACFRGKFIAVEVKCGRNKPSDEQIDFGRVVNRAGGIFLVAYDIDTVIKELDMIENGEA